MENIAVDILSTKEYKIKQRKSLKKRILKRWQIYLMLLIPLTYIIIFAYVPMSFLVIAFKKYDFTLGIWGSQWVGLANFQKFFSSYKFFAILKNTLSLSLYTLVLFPVPIILALLLNAFPFNRYKKTIQTVTYVPHFISVVVMVGLLTQLFNARNGLYGSLFTMFTNSTAPDLFAKGTNFKHLYVWSGVWQSMGYNSVIFFAALSGVDPSLHEAAVIDGASRFQRVKSIDFPSILPTVSILLVLQIGKLMNVGFEKVLLMQNSLNLNYSEIISTYVYKVGISSGIPDYSLSSAIGMFNSIINFILLITANKLSKKISGNGIF